MNAEFYQQYRSTRAMAPSSSKTRLERYLPTWYKTPNRRHVIPSMDNRRKTNALWRWLTCPRFRRIGEWREVDLRSNRRREWGDLASSDRKTTTSCTSHGKRTIAWTWTRRIFPNRNSPRGAVQYEIFFRQSRNPRLKMDSQKSYPNCGSRNISHTRILYFKTPIHIRTSPTETNVWHT